MNGRSHALVVTMGLAAAVACARDVTTSPRRSTLQPHPISFGSTAYSGNSVYAVHMRDGKSPFVCFVTAKQADGKFYKAVMGLHFSRAITSRSTQTRTVRVRWQPNGASIEAGANCRIPDVPEADAVLLKDMLFVDPKRVRGGVTGASSDFIPLDSRASTSTLPTIYVTASWTYGWGGSGGNSGSQYDPSVPSVYTWVEPGPTYVEPGEICDVNAPDGEVLPGVASGTNFAQSVEDACPMTWVDSICIDQYISDCTAFLVLRGDCRTADPYAGWTTSRAQLSIPLISPSDPDFQAVMDYFKLLTVSPSCLAISGYCHPPLDSTRNYVTITPYPDGDSVRVRWRFENSITGIAGRVPSPVIDGFLTFKRGTDGRAQILTLVRDNYPTLSVYQFSPFTFAWDHILQRNEGSALQLIQWVGPLDILRCVAP
jgi:hypothetical protein